MLTWLAAKLGTTVAKYVIGGALIAILAGGSFLTYKITGWFHASKITAYEKEIRELQEAGIKAQAEKFRLENEVSFLKKQKGIQKEKANVKVKLRETIKEPTPDNFVDYTRRFRVQPEGGTDPPKSGTRKSGSDNKPQP